MTVYARRWRGISSYSLLIYPHWEQHWCRPKPNSIFKASCVCRSLEWSVSVSSGSVSCMTLTYWPVGISIPFIL